MDAPRLFAAWCEKLSRPTELTPDVADRVAQFVRAGNWPETAAVAAGVSVRSFYRWMSRGQKAEQTAHEDEPIEPSEEPYRQFWQQVKRAESESEAFAVGYLMKSMPTTPTAVLSWLERRFRDRWSRMERIQHAGAGDGPIQIEDFRARVLEETSRVAERLLAVTEESGAGQRNDSLRCPLRLSNGLAHDVSGGTTRTVARSAARVLGRGRDRVGQPRTVQTVARRRRTVARPSGRYVEKASESAPAPHSR